MLRFGLALSFISLLSLSACHAKEDAGAAQSPKAASAAGVTDSASTPAGQEATDAALFLAGLPGRPESSFKSLESEPAWVEHAAQMEKLWSLYRDKRGPGMQRFQRTELVGAPIEGNKIWYPFSGGDAITMLTFFPGHQDYVMSALEPPGRVPKAAEFKPAVLSTELPGIANTLSSLLGKSFFVTREMDRQLRGQITDGVTVPVLIQLARLGYKVLDISYVQLDAQGQLVPRTLEAKRAAFGLNRGVQFDIQRQGESRARLLYLSLNLDDRHMKDNAAYQSYVASLGQPCAMLKATSYMLHSPAFSIIRDMLLKHASLIVQDDSGIPYRHFDPNVFDVQLYGDYTQPYGRDFAFRKQPDLRAAYEARRQSVKPMNFRMGYGAGRVDSNLQVARRKN